MGSFSTSQLAHSRPKGSKKSLEKTFKLNTTLQARYSLTSWSESQLPS